MPQLAEEILKRNENAKEDGSAPVINFSGFLVGNPYTDAFSNEVGAGVEGREEVNAPVR